VTPPVAAVAAPTTPPVDEDVYMGKISHVVLFNATSSAQSSIVGQSVLDTLMNSGAAGAGGSMALPGGMSPSSPPPGGMTPSSPPPGMAMPGMAPLGGGAGAATPSSRDSWKPLSPFMGGAGAGAGAGYGASGPVMPPMNLYSKLGEKTPAASSNSSHVREEFVVLFIWKEPTPSDALRGDDGTTPKPPTPPAGGMPGMPGMPSMSPAAAPPAAPAPLTPKSSIE
jgi:hypothetical protein